MLPKMDLYKDVNLLGENSNIQVQPKMNTTEKIKKIKQLASTVQLLEDVRALIQEIESSGATISHLGLDQGREVNIKDPYPILSKIPIKLQGRMYQAINETLVDLREGLIEEINKTNFT